MADAPKNFNPKKASYPRKTFTQLQEELAQEKEKNRVLTEKLHGKSSRDAAGVQYTEAPGNPNDAEKVLEDDYVIHDRRRAFFGPSEPVKTVEAPAAAQETNFSSELKDQKTLLTELLARMDRMDAHVADVVTLKAEVSSLREELRMAREAAAPEKTKTLRDHYDGIKRLAIHCLDSAESFFLQTPERRFASAAAITAATFVALNHATLRLPGLEQHMSAASASLTSAHTHVVGALQKTQAIHGKALAALSDHVSTLADQVKSLLTEKSHKVAEHVRRVSPHLHKTVEHVHHAVIKTTEVLRQGAPATFVGKTFETMSAVRTSMNDQMYDYAVKALANTRGAEHVLTLFHPDHVVAGDRLAQARMDDVFQFSDIYSKTAQQAMETKVSFLNGQDPTTLKQLEQCFVPAADGIKQVKPIPDDLKHKVLVNALNYVRENGTELVKAHSSLVSREGIDALTGGSRPVPSPDKLQTLLTHMVDKLHIGARLAVEQTKNMVANLGDSWR